MLTLDDLTHCFAVPGTGKAIDAVHPITGLGVWSGETLEQVRVRYPGAERMTYDDVAAESEAVWRKPPTETTREHFERMLNVLPPVDFTGDTFKMVERDSGNITAIFARVGGRYFVMHDDIRMGYGEIIAKVREVAQ